MEMNIHCNIILNFLRTPILLLFVLGFMQTAFAQPEKNGISVSGQKIFLSIHKETSEIELKSISDHYELEELPIMDWLLGKKLETVTQYGWKIEKQQGDWLVLSKPLEKIGDLAKIEKKILLAAQHMPGNYLYPLGVYRKDFGYNKLRDPRAISISGGKITFFVEGLKNAFQVKIAGSFTQWENEAIPMKKVTDGWTITLNLESGKYFYKIIADGTWLLHGANKLKENDGKGNTNSVLFVPNYFFSLDGYFRASKVVVAGSFNGWSSNEAILQKSTSGWNLPVYLPEGTYTYRFVVDGRWMADPVNPQKVQNEFGEYNSLVKLGKPFIFRLDGFENAQKVVLVGSFNQWKNEELLLEKRAGGWEIPFTLGQGNHEYYYFVDGDRIGRMPKNEKFKKPEVPLNFNVIINPNYTFSLKGYHNASTVYLSGSFNNWSETGFPMIYENGEWKLKVNLPAGKQTYKFVVDGKWMIDPANPLWEQNEHATRNSVLWIDDI